MQKLRQRTSGERKDTERLEEEKERVEVDVKGFRREELKVKLQRYYNDKRNVASVKTGIVGVGQKTRRKRPKEWDDKERNTRTVFHQ